MGGLSSLLDFIIKAFKKIFKFIRKYFVIFLMLFIILAPWLAPLLGTLGTWVAMLPSWLSWLPTVVDFFAALGFPGVIAAAFGIGYILDPDTTKDVVGDVLDVTKDVIEAAGEVAGSVGGSLIGSVFKNIPGWLWIGLGAYFVFSGSSDSPEPVEREVGGRLGQANNDGEAVPGPMARLSKPQ